jgi:hypothetical protein
MHPRAPWEGIVILIPLDFTPATAAAVCWLAFLGGVSATRNGEGARVMSEMGGRADGIGCSCMFPKKKKNLCLLLPIILSFDVCFYCFM